MAELVADEEKLQGLRRQLAEYEQIFRTAAPRLAAFKRLEELARDQKTTPVAIAAEAALVMLTRESVGMREEIGRLETACSNLKGDLAMLLQSKDRTTDELDGLRIEHGGIQAEVVEILNELHLLRNDAVRLLAERRQLQQELQVLRAEVGQLHGRRTEAQPVASEQAVMVAAVPRRTAAGFALDDDDEGRRFDDFFHANVEHDKARDWILG